MGETSEASQQRPDLKIIPGEKLEPIKITNIKEYKPFHPSAQREDTTGNVVPLHKK